MIAKETPNFFIASPLAARPARGQLTSTLSSGPAPVPPLRPVDFRLAGVLIVVTEGKLDEENVTNKLQFGH